MLPKKNKLPITRLVLYPYLSANTPNGICPIEEEIKYDEITIDTSVSDKPIKSIKITNTPIVKVESLVIIEAPISQLFEE